MIDRDKFDESLKVEIEDETGFSVGLSDVPDKTPEIPYYILSWSPAPKPSGSMADPEDMIYFDYSVKSIGRNHKETARAASKLRSAFVGRGDDSKYLRSLDTESVAVVIRETISLGMIVRSNAPELFEVNDIYRICVTERFA